MTSPVSPSETIAKAMEGVTPPDKLHVVFSTWKEDGSINIRRWSTFMEFDGSTAYIAEPSVNAVTKERDALALQLEAMQREMVELRSTLAGDHECKPLSEDRLDEILEFEERFKMLGGAGDTASLDWSTQRALIDEAVLACRARALIQGEKK